MKMKKGAVKQVLVSGVALLVLTAAGSAIAARPSPSVNVPIAASFNRTGPYIGINGGYGWGSAKNSFRVDGSGGNSLGTPDNVFAPENTAGSFTQNLTGGVAGGQVGFNQQWGPIVFGLEAMLDGSGIGRYVRMRTLE